MNSYDIIADAVKRYWRITYPQDVIAFFWQKYEDETEWEWLEELVEAMGEHDYENMMFLNDFCEGQTCVKDIAIVPLNKVTAYYAENRLHHNTVRKC